jgi:hypothetical protein
MNYRDIPAENQSVLKKILIHPKLYLDAKNKQEMGEESDEDHFVFGSVVDLRLEGNREEFERKFVVIDDDGEGSEKIRNIIKCLFNFLLKNTNADTIKSINLEDCEDYIIEFAKQEGYGGKTYTRDKIIENVLKANKYFETLKTSIGKRIISN